MTIWLESPYLTKSESARYCRVCTRTLENHQEIPRLKAGKKILFRRQDLDDWLRAGSPQIQKQSLSHVVDEVLGGLQEDESEVHKDGE